MHSEADISKAKTLLGYEPSHSIKDGLTEAIEWYCQKLGPAALRHAQQPAVATGTYS